MADKSTNIQFDIYYSFNDKKSKESDITTKKKKKEKLTPEQKLQRKGLENLFDENFQEKLDKKLARDAEIKKKEKEKATRLTPEQKMQKKGFENLFDEDFQEKLDNKLARKAKAKRRAQKVKLTPEQKMQMKSLENLFDKEFQDKLNKRLNKKIKELRGYGVYGGIKNTDEDVLPTDTGIIEPTRFNKKTTGPEMKSEFGLVSPKGSPFNIEQRRIPVTLPEKKAIGIDRKDKAQKYGIDNPKSEADEDTLPIDTGIAKPTRFNKKATGMEITPDTGLISSAGPPTANTQENTMIGTPKNETINLLADITEKQKGLEKMVMEHQKFFSKYMGPLSQGIDIINKPESTIGKMLPKLLSATGPHGRLIAAAIGTIIAAAKIPEKTIQALSKKGWALNQDWHRSIDTEVTGMLTLEQQKKRILGLDAWTVSQTQGYKPVSGTTIYNSLLHRDEIRLAKAGQDAKAKGIEDPYD